MYTQAALALHNFLRTTESAVYCPPGKVPIAVRMCTCTTCFGCFLGFVDAEDGAGNTIEGRWRADQDPCQSLEPMRRVGSNRCACVLCSCCELFKFAITTFFVQLGIQDLLQPPEIPFGTTSPVLLESYLGSIAMCIELING